MKKGASRPFISLSHRQTLFAISTAKINKLRLYSHIHQHPSKIILMQKRRKVFRASQRYSPPQPNKIIIHPLGRKKHSASGCLIWSSFEDQGEASSKHCFLKAPPLSRAYYFYDSSISLSGTSSGCS